MVIRLRIKRCVKRAERDDGFTLIELLIATFTGMIVLGAGVTLVSQVQRGYTSQLENASV